MWIEPVYLEPAMLRLQACVAHNYQFPCCCCHSSAQRKPRKLAHGTCHRPGKVQLLSKVQPIAAHLIPLTWHKGSERNDRHVQYQSPFCLLCCVVNNQVTHWQVTALLRVLACKRVVTSEQLCRFSQGQCHVSAALQWCPPRSGELRQTSSVNVDVWVSIHLQSSQIDSLNWITH